MISLSDFQALHCCNFSGTKDFTLGILCSKFKPINLSGKIKETPPPQLLCKRATGTSSSSIFRPNSRARMVTSKFNQGQSISETANKNHNNKNVVPSSVHLYHPNHLEGQALIYSTNFLENRFQKCFLALQFVSFAVLWVSNSVNPFSLASLTTSENFTPGLGISEILHSLSLFRSIWTTWNSRALWTSLNIF